MPELELVNVLWDLSGPYLFRLQRRVEGLSLSFALFLSLCLCVLKMYLYLHVCVSMYVSIYAVWVYVLRRRLYSCNYEWLLATMCRCWELNWFSDKSSNCSQPLSHFSGF